MLRSRTIMAIQWFNTVKTIRSVYIYDVYMAYIRYIRRLYDIYTVNSTYTMFFFKAQKQKLCHLLMFWKKTINKSTNFVLKR